MIRSVACAVALVLALGALAPALRADPPPGGDPPGNQVPAQADPQHPEGPGGGDAEIGSRPIHVHQAREREDQATAILLLATLLLFSGFALLMLVVALAPDVTASIMTEVRASFLKRFLVGVANTLFLFVLVKISGNALAILVVPFLVLLLLFGLIVLSDEVGRRLQRISGGEWNRVQRIGAGWATLYLASWFPAVGWFVVAPVATFTAVGTVLLWLLTLRSRRATAAAATPPSASPVPPAPPSPPIPPSPQNP